MSNRMKKPKVPTWRQTTPDLLSADGPELNDPVVALRGIFKDAPDRSFLGDKPMAVFSATCCWWSSNPHTAGKTPNAGLPGCPSCGSVLYQGPLEHFIERSKEHPEHYGENGLYAFVAAHNAVPCHRDWDEYDLTPPKALEMSDLLLPAGVRDEVDAAVAEADAQVEGEAEA